MSRFLALEVIRPRVLWIVIAGAGCAEIVDFDIESENSDGACSNGRDDDLDGASDCDDSDCAAYCPEICSNFRDDDGDAWIDGEDLTCWVEDPEQLGFTEAAARPERCATLLGSEYRLEPSARWRVVRGSGVAQWSESTLVVQGGSSCRGARVVGTECPGIELEPSITGGGCWSMAVELQLERNAEVSIVAAPGPDAPVLGREDALVATLGRLDASRIEASVRAGWSATATTAVLTANAEDSLRWVLTSSSASCAGESVEVRVEISGASPSTPDLVLRSPVPTTGEWRAQTALRIATRASGPGAWTLRGAEIERVSSVPCGFPMPQLRRYAEGPLRVRAVARGAGKICLWLSSFERAPMVPEYRPRVHQGSPPPPDEGPSSTFTVHVPDRGLASFETEPRVSSPSPVFFGENRETISASMTFDGTRFFATALVRDGPRGEPRLVRSTSRDCERWVTLPYQPPGYPDGSVLHPVHSDASGPRRVLFAEPAGPYAARDDPRCDNEPEQGFRAPMDPVPMVKPRRSECMLYPRGLVWEQLGEGPLEPRAALPSHAEWTVQCGCVAPGSLIPGQQGPTRITQAFSQGVELGYVGASERGLQLIVDATPTDLEPVLNDLRDALTSPGPLLGPNPEVGTFDYAGVASPQLLMLGSSEGLLFYTGFRTIRSTPEGEVRTGGDVGVLPVIF